ncbi:hypothetical protein ABIE44_001686 [Marmoricola sp. OAE513]|uniref:hypothetical protein n=1 Tax=Marmoricola sp. OAE513 TaxID=2817894 RepID=UPI001AE27C5F
MRKTLLVALTTLALVLGFATLADAATAKKSFKVSIKSNVATSQAGRFIVISGKVSGPGAGGKKVKIQRQYIGGAWTNVATVVTKKSGKYKAVVETPQGGTTSFRVIKAKSSARKAGVSATKALPVYKWLYLDHEPVNSFSSDYQAGLVQQIDGKTYAHSYRFSAGNSYLAFKLSGLCTTFTTRADYNVFSGPQPVDTYTLKTIAQKSSGPAIQKSVVVSLFTPVTASQSLVGVRTLGVNLESLNAAPYYAVLGDPKVYCNAEHLPSWVEGDFI